MSSQYTARVNLHLDNLHTETRIFTKYTDTGKKKKQAEVVMYKRGLIALKQQKMSDQKKKTKGNRTFDGQALLVVCFSRGWGGVGGRSLVLVVAHY